MSLVINNLIQKINSRIDSADATFSTLDLRRIEILNNRINGPVPLGTIQYRSLGQVPAANDSSDMGKIIFVRDEQLDSDGRYYYKGGRSWINLITGDDSDENVLITAAASSSGASEPSFSYQGDTQGLILGARNPGTPTNPSQVQSISFTTDGNATDAGDLTVGGYGGGAYGDGTYAYAAGGAPIRNRVERAPYSTLTTFSDIGDLTKGGQYFAPSNDATHGYVAGGYRSPGSYQNYLDRFSFAATTTSNEVGTVSPNPAGGLSGGNSSDTHGYHAGGYNYVNYIIKFPFAASATSADVGDLSVARRTSASSSSTTYGYNAQGLAPGVYSNVIDKFPFASDGNATDVGNATAAKRYSGGASSTTHGYHSGGFGPTYSGGIGKYAYASDGDATTVGAMTYPGDFVVGGGAND